MNTDNLMLFGLDLTEHLMDNGADGFVEAVGEYHPHDITKALNAVGMLVTQVLASLLEQPKDSVIRTYSDNILEASTAVGVHDEATLILDAIGRPGQSVQFSSVDLAVANSYELILGTLIGVCSTLDEILPEEFIDRLRGVAT
ncbi:hypothetical protein [Glutamicibacter ardleyensis]|uniref:hypothetical protein n=1 Tax=Glutamicibacter ardleyensis TaxID=225894 RepID=UPI003FD54D08